MKNISLALIVTMILPLISCNSVNTPMETCRKPRILITTDIGGDPDDTQSLIRLLVTSNEIELEGLIASASGTPDELDTLAVRPDLIKNLIEAYGLVHENLLLHQEDFPHPGQLVSLVKNGNPMRGLDYIGEGMDTEGSKWIEKSILKEDSRPLNICVWGGQTDLTQALFSLKKRLSTEGFDKATENIRIYNINDQDRIHHWFSKEFPGLFHILAMAPEGTDIREGVYRGIYLGGDESLTSREWVYKHVKDGHGALGALYPEQTWTAPNPHGCLKEGDTPSWFYFLNNGLQDPSHPSYGGWGGRFLQSDRQYYTDNQDQLDTLKSARATVYRWRKDFQNDFEARMDWCVLPFEEANHHPTAVVNGDKSKKVILLEVKDRERVILDAGGSDDPDGDELAFRWWIYPEPSGMEVGPPMAGHQGETFEIKTGDYPGSSQIHLILEVRDRAQPSLTSYRRIIIVRNTTRDKS